MELLLFKTISTTATVCLFCFPYNCVSRSTVVVLVPTLQRANMLGSFLFLLRLAFLLTIKSIALQERKQELLQGLQEVPHQREILTV